MYRTVRYGLMIGSWICLPVAAVTAAPREQDRPYQGPKTTEAPAAGEPGAVERSTGDEDVSEAPTLEGFDALTSEFDQAPTHEDVEEVGDISEFDLSQLLGNVSSVSRRQESLAKAPASVTILDRGDIRRSGARTIPDVLRAVPGVQVVENAPGSYIVSLRGMAGLQGNNVVVLVDGVSMNRVVDGSIDWGGLPVHIDDIERIEVVRGPVSPVYGANAYAGVINLITSEPVAEGPWGSARAMFGTDWNGNMGQRVLGTVGGRREWVRWHVAADLGRDALFSENMEVEHPEAEKQAVLGKFDFAVDDDQSITVKTGASRTRHSSLDHLVLESNPQQNDLAFGYLGYTFENLPSVADYFSVWARGRRFAADTRKELYEGFSYHELESAEGLSGVDLGFDFPHEINWGIGGNAGLAYVDAPFLHADENRKIRPRYGFYTDASIDAFDALYVNAAVRADNSAMLDTIQWSYRAAATYYRDQMSIRLSGGSAFREPTFVEVGGRFTDPDSGLILLDGTPGLSPPRVDSVELGGLFLVGHTLTLRPTVYFARMQNLMVADFEPLVRKTFRNDREARPLLGGEFEVEWQFLPSMDWKTTGAALVWLKEVEDLSATVAVPEQNSAFSLWSGIHGSWVDDRLSFGLGLGYTTPRRYRVRAGIPPRIINVDVGHRVRPETVLEYQFLPNHPFWVWTRAFSALPHARVESPFPGASRLGTAVFVGVGYRG